MARSTGSRWLQVQRAEWYLLILGIWLFISPWVLNTVSWTTRSPFGTTTAHGASPGDFWWVGGALFVLALLAFASWSARWVAVIAGLLGVWLFISPWVLDFALARASWNAWIVGVLVVLVSLWWLSLAPKTTARRAMWGRRMPI